MRFTVAEVLAGKNQSVGTMAMVFKLTDDRVARMPRSAEGKPVLFMKKFMEGAEQTSQWFGKEVVAVENSESVAPFVTFTEYLDIAYTLDQLSNAYNDVVVAQGSKPKTVEVNGIKVDFDRDMQQLREFFKITATMGANDDFDGRQIGKVRGRGWVWFDLYPSDPVTTVLGGGLLRHDTYLPKGMWEVMFGAIESSRRELGWPLGACEATSEYMDGGPDILDFGF